MNSWNNSNFNTPYGTAPSYGSPWERPMTNIEYVTSLEEALSRTNQRNVEKVYFHQDAPIFYRIKVDSDGKKYWQEFTYDTPKPAEDTLPATKADLTDIVERIKRPP